MVQCDRCGRPMPYPHIIRFEKKVGLVESVFNVKAEDYNLCNSCTKSFRRWLSMGIRE